MLQFIHTESPTEHGVHSKNIEIIRSCFNSDLTMRNLFIPLIVFCTAFNSLRAQQTLMPKVNRFGLGIFTGLNYSFPVVSTKSPTYFEPQSSLVAGINLQYHLTNQASFHLQPSWTQVNDVKSKNSWVHSTFSITTVKLPVVYRYYISPNRKLFFVQTGISYNYLTSSKFREQLDIVCITGPCPAIIGPNRPSSNKSAVSGIAGIGINIELQKISIPITLQYERYFSNYLFPDQYDAQPARVKFESFALTTGINF
jgi:hypothetical protein